VSVRRALSSLRERERAKGLRTRHVRTFSNLNRFGLGLRGRQATTHHRGRLCGLEDYDKVVACIDSFTLGAEAEGDNFCLAER